ncbi:GNAT superfamily N-acetyltransferase [Saccharothrix tamanrassetensis]|uniref:GNAT superfamily N-acetyltransferase n=1 Tax=Saccharothrix tamanrassetensis TaxID=1051531 RepID=A0A841CK48_9PSEU|nr:GNAT family N-acetyltransferase [Saccharothrix tamanrassetensis]MBB5957333.1 GNAT superfamily N-acetyltransferase [Saccharothrix tamanrassetensis]
MTDDVSQHGPTGEHVLTEVDAPRLLALAEPLERLYRACFAAPPWNEDETHFAGFADRLARHVAEPALRGFVAWSDDEPAAVVYGWPSAPEVPSTPFYTGAYTALDPGERYRLRPPAIEVVELMVAPRHRGHRLGERLLEHFVEGFPRAWLCTHPEAPARRFYRARGWVERGAFSDANGVPLVVFTLDRAT